MPTHNLEQLLLSSLRVLLLQGPVGPFFQELSNWLLYHQKAVWKINFNGGDLHYFRAVNPNPSLNCAVTVEQAAHASASSFNTSQQAQVLNYTQPATEFADYLRQLVAKQNIDTMVCFGDCRLYHQIAKQVCKELGLKFWVFEEGYFRPHYVTLEATGVNAYSHLPKNASYYRKHMRRNDEPAVAPISSGFWAAAWLATIYYLYMWWYQAAFPHYAHHRATSLKTYARCWLKSAWRRCCYVIPEALFTHKVEQGKLGEFFLLALQVHSDSQVKVHSTYNSVAEFLEEVLINFAMYAPERTHLVVKHHPMDRGFTNYREQINKIVAAYPQLEGRIHYVLDVPLPILLRKAQGLVCLNSTTGLSALVHNLPVLTLGDCAYDFAQLTHQGSLASFWVSPQAPDATSFAAYRRYHLYTTQLNGSFYKYVRFVTPNQQLNQTRSWEETSDSRLSL
ncbi:capsule biosynthesis protein [Psittacicella hinzii]|uniref:Capsular polysaccharide export protein n=1 Tax=Psittacicella hinzii TaxID=2028575 RepID=A0A3A1YMC1_9GAMM|nr:capsular biosynthesis protein [Psittacicella hinzii]RIY38701.1 hypothetical protein CKF58_03615 [Psittacicella hinzii]